MSAFDDEFHVLDDNRWKRLRRDVRLIRWIVKSFLAYLIVGGRIRRNFNRKKKVGEPYWID